MTQNGEIPWEEETIENEEEISENLEELSSKLGEISQRCKAANLEISILEMDDRKVFRIKIPSGRDSRFLVIRNIDDAKYILGTNFEKIRFIPSYEGIWNTAENSAEVAITGRTFAFDRIIGLREEGKINLFPSREGLPEISIAPRSDSLSFYSSRFLTRSKQYSILFNNISAHKSEDVTSLIEKLGNSLLYQMDVAWGISMSLMRERRRIYRPFMSSQKEKPELLYPSHEYESAPISLYRYGRNSLGMPLLQFLAYYQVAEYYFPYYSKSEAQRRIKIILKDPEFRIESDKDVGKIISCLKQTRSGGLFDEKTQLKATMREVVNSEELYKFLNEYEYNKYFEKDYKSIHSTKIKITPQFSDAIDEVAERLYGIRCKIVHTKSDGDSEVELMLPYSKEEQGMGPDIELMRFVARSCLNASGLPIR